mmetsp:Transcript_7617/g.12462  ORF Transcript_7617/g.12462 Transcript_7617/m.12462 type:complete len:204 (+) Transcript_7617:87-698(+)
MAKSVSGTAVYGQQGTQMLNNLRRAAWLPQYDADGNRKVIEEIGDLYTKIHNTLMAAKDVDTTKPEALTISCSVIVHHNALQRNKRILFAYHRYRTDVLEDYVWEKGALLTEFARNKINPHEELYFKNYANILKDYMEEVDVTITSVLSPPKELKQEVQIMDNIGDIQTGDGTMSLVSGTRTFCEMNEVETFLRNGQVVKTKE